MVEYFLNSMENFFKHELISFPMKEVEDDSLISSSSVVHSLAMISQG